MNKIKVLTHMFSEDYIVMFNMLVLRECGYRNSLPKIKSLTKLFGSFELVKRMFKREWLYLHDHRKYMK